MGSSSNKSTIAFRISPNGRNPTNTIFHENFLKFSSLPVRDLEVRILNFAENLLREMEITAPLNCMRKFFLYRWNQSCLKIETNFFGSQVENIELMTDFLLDNSKKIYNESFLPRTKKLVEFFVHQKFRK